MNNFEIRSGSATVDASVNDIDNTQKVSGVEETPKNIKKTEAGSIRSILLQKGLDEEQINEFTHILDDLNREQILNFLDMIKEN